MGCDYLTFFHRTIIEVFFIQIFFTHLFKFQFFSSRSAKRGGGKSAKRKIAKGRSRVLQKIEGQFLQWAEVRILCPARRRIIPRDRLGKCTGQANLWGQLPRWLGIWKYFLLIFMFCLRINIKPNRSTVTFYPFYCIYFFPRWLFFIFTNLNIRDL